MKRITFLSALTALLFMGYCSNAKGTNSPDAKTTDAIAASASKSETEAGTVKWFHFNGSNSNPSDLTDPTKYSAETSPVCPTDTPENRCDIKIASQSTNQNLPDLSQPVMEERTRDAD